MTGLLLSSTPSSAALEDCEGDLTPSNPENSIVELRFQPPIGSICIEMFEQPDQAPFASANFLIKVQNGEWSRTFVDRVHVGSLLVFGNFTAEDDTIRESDGLGPIVNESCELNEATQQCDERGNEAGTLAMTATDGSIHSWFINLDDNRNNAENGLNLDVANAVFARILGDGLETLRAVADYDFFPVDELYYSITFDPLLLIQEIAPLRPPNSVPPEDRGDQMREEWKRVPVVEIPQEESSDEFGCFDLHDMSNLYTVFDPETFPSGTEASANDPSLPVVLAFVDGRIQPISRARHISAGCGTALDSHLDFDPQPNDDPECSFGDGGDDLTDRMGFSHRTDMINDQFYEDVGNLKATSYTCQDVAEFDHQLETRRAVMGERIVERLALIEEARVVPEPAAGATAAASAVTLAFLAARRRRAA